jgi:hypothetical protein
MEEYFQSKFQLGCHHVGGLVQLRLCYFGFSSVPPRWSKFRSSALLYNPNCPLHLIEVEVFS